MRMMIKLFRIPDIDGNHDVPGTDIDPCLTHCDEELNYVSQHIEESNIHHHVDRNFEN